MTHIIFKQQVIEMQDRLMSFARMLTSDRDEARDLLQDTTLKALDREDNYRENTNFQGWMTTIMRNIFINNYRKRKRHATVVDTTEDLYHINTSDEAESVSPEDVYSTHEIIEKLGQLGELYREPFVMYLKGYRYQEIAAITGTPVGTVKSRIFFARRQLRTMLAGYRD
ncbi:MAG: sigma-70 family RNA polymerase sigma factor [Prevotella sp.]|nr:sigma-70 family RNA polymerase sigma factor [Prevotella sp.]MCM1075706.1 sigma-70 family RNA polymerase sigma factor [Ruminococcus sp.]